MLTGVDGTESGTESPGATLRRLREASKHSLAGLAARAGLDKSLISRLETGGRPMKPHHAELLDQALGTGKMLQALVETTGEEGGGMKRRATLWAITSALTVTAATSGRAVVDELLRRGLLDAIEEPDDWDATVAEMQRRLVLAPDAEFGTMLGGKLLMVRQAIADKDNTDEIRAAAMLSLFYGLWQGNNRQFTSALDWYRTAAALARQSDPETETYVLGRSASRAVYEGMSRHEVTEKAERALAVTSARTLGRLEAESALAGVAAMTGDLDGGRDRVKAMREITDHLADDSPTGAYPRTVNFHLFVEARTGDMKSAEKAQEEAERALARTPLWLAESRVYYALAMARAGAVRGAATVALDAIQTVPWSVHTLAMAAADVLTAVPRDNRSDEVEELRRYASTEPGPWETL